MSESRDAAAAIVELADSGPGIRIRKAKVTAVHAGPPARLDLEVEGRWQVNGVPYLMSYDSPAVDDAVYVLGYGTGRRLVLGQEA